MIGSPSVPASVRTPRPWVAYLGVGLLGFVAYFILELLRGEPLDVPVIAAMSALLFVLVLARLRTIIGDHRVAEANLRRSEEALRASELRYRTLVEQASDALFITDPAGRLIEVNPATCALLGYTRDELLTLSAADLVPQETEDELGPRLERLRSGEAVLSERRFPRKDGSLVPVEINVRMLPNGQYHAIVRDISERKAAEAERDRLAAAVEQASDIVLMTDADANIVYVNPAFSRTTGFRPAQVLGRSVRDLPQAPGHERADADMHATLATGQSWSGPIFGAKADGTPLDLDMVISPIHDASGEPSGAVSVARDVSRERALETQLRQAQKMEAVGRLAGGIAHDFNNLLGAIRGYTELTHLASHPGEEIHEYSAEVLRAADRAKLLTQRLLTFARQQPSSPESVDLNDVVDGLEPMLRQIVDERTPLLIELAREPVVAHIDVALFEQAILNLVINARDAIAGAGSIRLSTRRRNVGSDGSDADSELEPGSYSVLSVVDTGAGIAPENLPHLFEPFFTTKPISKGTGLGLSIVYAVASGAGGTVRVDSAPAAGACFEIILPSSEQPLPVVPRAAQAPNATVTGSEPILLVEDEPAVRSFVRRVLSRGGYAVREAGSAEEALAFVESGAAPALLITDVLLPGASGPQLSARLRERLPGLGVLFMSGYDGDRLSPDGRFESGTAFLPKPFAAEELLRAVRGVLDAINVGAA